MSQLSFALYTYFNSTDNTYYTVAMTSPTTLPAGGTRIHTPPQDLGAIVVSTDPATITGATNATPIVITTSAAHGYSTNDFVDVINVGGNTAANGTFQITVVTSTTFQLNQSVGNAAYTSGGTCQKLKTTKNYMNSLQEACTSVKNALAV